MLNPGFQVNLDVDGRDCLVIGGNDEATEKTGRLLDGNGRVRLVSPEITNQLRTLCEAGLLRHEERPFEPRDLDGVFLVVNAVASDPELTARVYELATARGLLINSFDNPAYSNFGMVALVRAGHLRLAVSTSNASPSLSRRLRQDLAALFDDEFVEYLELLAQVRKRLRDTVEDRERRFAMLRALVTDFGLSGRLNYPADWRRKIKELLRR